MTWRAVTLTLFTTLTFNAAASDFSRVEVLVPISKNERAHIDDARVGAFDGVFFFLTNTHLWMMQTDDKGQVHKTRHPLPSSLAQALGEAGALILPDSSSSSWVLHRPTRQIWRWKDRAWSGPWVTGESFFGAGATPSGSLVLNTPEHPAHTFAFVTPGKSPTHRFGEAETSVLTALNDEANAWLIATDAQGRMVAAHTHRGLIRIFSAEGKLVRELESAPRAASQQMASDVDVDAETCCVEARILRHATALTLTGEEIIVRIGLEPLLRRWHRTGERLEDLVIRAPQPWLTGGIAMIDERLVASGSEGVSLYLPMESRAPFETRVSREDGEPIAGATVQLTTEAGRLLVLRSNQEGLAGSALVLTTDMARVEVSAEGYASAVLSGALADLTSIVLRPSPRICMTVRDRVTGAAVERYSTSISRVETGVSSRVLSVARKVNVEDSSGRSCTSANLPLPWVVEVESEGHARASRRITSTEPLELELGPEAPLEVRVISGERDPVPGARVSLRLAAQDDPGYEALREYAIALTDSEGAARLQGFGEGAYRLEVSHPDFLPLQQHVDLPLGELPLRLELDPGASLGVRVVDRSSGAPVRDAAVQIDPTGHRVPKKLECRTGDQGRCEISGLPVGRFRVHASAEGRAGVREPLTVAEGARELGIEITMDRGMRITGLVSGLAAYPDLSAEVVISVPKTPLAVAPVTTKGDFRIESASPGRAAVWVRDRISREMLVYRNEEIPEGTTEHYLSLELPPPIAVSGLIRRVQRPCGTCRITWSRVGADIGRPVRSASAGLDGRYAVRLTEGGRYLVRVSDQTSAIDHSELVNVDRDLERNFDIGGRRVAVTVVDPQSAGVADASIQILSVPDGLPLAAATTDVSGRAEVSVPGSDGVRVTAIHGGRTGETLLAAGGTGDEQIEIRLREGGVRIRLVDAASGQAVPRISLLTAGTFGTISYRDGVRADTDGLISTGAPAGSTLVVGATGYAIKTLRQVSDGITIAMIPGGHSFHVAVGEELRGCAIDLRQRDGASTALSARTAPGPVAFPVRQAMFNLIEPGEYQLVLSLCSGEQLTRSLSLQRGVTPLVRFAD